MSSDFIILLAFQLRTCAQTVSLWDSVTALDVIFEIMVIFCFRPCKGSSESYQISQFRKALRFHYEDVAKRACWPALWSSEPFRSFVRPGSMQFVLGRSG